MGGQTEVEADDERDRDVGMCMAAEQREIRTRRRRSGAQESRAAAMTIKVDQTSKLDSCGPSTSRDLWWLLWPLNVLLVTSVTTRAIDCRFAFHRFLFKFV